MHGPLNVKKAFMIFWLKQVRLVVRAKFRVGGLANTSGKSLTTLSYLAQWDLVMADPSSRRSSFVKQLRSAATSHLHMHPGDPKHTCIITLVEWQRDNFFLTHTIFSCLVTQQWYGIFSLLPWPYDPKVIHYLISLQSSAAVRQQCEDYL
jgi:hypothetical protein